MIIAQLSDTHLGFEPDNPAEFNRKRLDEALKALATMTPRPDLLIVTGDLTDRGDRDSYERLRIALAAAPCRVLLCMGNHDVRSAFTSVFPEVGTAGGFVQYVEDLGGLRIVVLDTLEEGRHGGGFCEQRAAWLRSTLAQAPDRPTLLAFHHPPFETGIDWMSTDPVEPWVTQLEGAVAGHRQIVGSICGHIHRPIVTAWAGAPIAVCPATAPPVALELAPIDPARPDDRPLIVADPPGFALHRWNGRRLVTHFDRAEPHVVLARFDERLKPLIASLMAERPGEVQDAA